MNSAHLTPPESRSGLGEVLRMSWPASLSMLNRTLAQFIDAAMVARLGPVVISAQQVGGLIAFVPESFSIGVLGVVNTYVSQNLGAGRPHRCGRYGWAGIFIAMALSALFMPLAAVARPIFAWIGHAPAVQAHEVLYFRYMILSVPLTMSLRVLESFFYGLHRPMVIFAVSSTGTAFNVLANYALIFGNFGMPALGLQGAAIATVVSWGLQLVILLGVFLSERMKHAYGTRDIRAAGLTHCLDIVRIGWAAGVSFLLDLGSWAIFNTYLIGQFGTAHLNAATAAVRYMSLSFMPAVGIGFATTALVGRHIGMGRPDVARKRAHTALLTAMVYMGLCGAAFLIFRRQLVDLFVDTPPGSEFSEERIISIGSRILICAAVFQLFDAMLIVFTGALRGAGDTRWPMVVTAIANLVILVGGGLAIVRVLPELESLGPYLMATLYLIVLAVVMARRFESGAWKKFKLVHRDED